MDWDTWLPDGRYPHTTQVHERLSFLRFLLKDGQLWLCAEQVNCVLKYNIRFNIVFIKILMYYTIFI